MKRQIDAEVSLQPERTFVVQLRSNADVAQRQMSGRIEHLMSGDSVPFTSLEAILTFMAKHTTGDGGAEG